MGNDYPHSYHGLPGHNFAPRSLSDMGHINSQVLNNEAPSHYQTPVTLSSPQSSTLAVKTGQHSLDHMGSMHYQNSLPMWHPVHSQSPNLAMSMMPQNQQAALSMMLQSQGLRYYPGPAKIFPSPMQQSQSAQFYHASVACSKRFSEEEKQKLEKVFTSETQKPSTSRKRQLAEELGCPVPKVNNWFQNRRAREKQMHRVQAYEASQAADRVASENDSAEAQDDEDDDAFANDFDSTSNHSQVKTSSSGQFTDTDSSLGHENPSPVSFDDQHRGASSPNSPTMNPTSVGCTSSKAEESEQPIKAERESSAQLQSQLGSVEAVIPSSFEEHQNTLSSSPDTYADSLDGGSFHALDSHFATNYCSFGSLAGLGVLDHDIKPSEFFPASTPFMAQRTPTITTNMIGDDDMEDHSTGRPSEMSDFSGLDSLSPDMIPQPSPPTPDHEELTHDRTSPNSSIASRRKTRPPQRLNQTALRNYPNGPKTGVEGAKRSDMYGTMRRAASASGPLSGKIFKSGPPVSPLSPRSFDPNFLEQLARTSSLNVSSSLKEASSASPVGSMFEQRYLSADNAGMGIQHRSSSLSLNSFGDSISLSPSIAEHPRDMMLHGTHGHGHNLQHFQHPKFVLDTGCGNVSPDEALTTPGLSQFGSELEFPTSLSAPRYVESEPTTPSYVPVTAPTSSAGQGHGFPTLKIETPPQADIFPWSRSPDQMSVWNGGLGHFGEPQSTTFQFQPNVTPQNFNSPTGA